VPDLSRPGTAEQPRPVNVILRDYDFDPSLLYLVAGETVRFNVVNGGLVEHEFVLGNEAVQRAWAEAHAAATPPAPFASPPPASVPPDLSGLRLLLGSGGATSAVYEVPDGVALQLYCHLPGHVAQGMVGQVVVAEASAAARLRGASSFWEATGGARTGSHRAALQRAAAKMASVGAFESRVAHRPRSHIE
jgi:uncharacterized cupredoxin-like copper-binding protein